MRAIVPVEGLVHVPDELKVLTTGAAAAGAALVHVVPFEVSTLPDVPGATACRADVPLPSNTLLAVNVDAPVPPRATPNVPLLICAAEMLLFVRVWVAVVRTTSPAASGRFSVRFVFEFGAARVKIPVPLALP
jgi:hypothetical protein